MPFSIPNDEGRIIRLGADTLAGQTSARSSEAIIAGSPSDAGGWIPQLECPVVWAEANLWLPLSAHYAVSAKEREDARATAEGASLPSEKA